MIIEIAGDHDVIIRENVRWLKLTRYNNAKAQVSYGWSDGTRINYHNDTYVTLPVDVRTKDDCGETIHLRTFTRSDTCLKYDCKKS